jgi:hypothetical protein
MPKVDERWISDLLDAVVGICPGRLCAAADDVYWLGTQMSSQAQDTIM